MVDGERIKVRSFLYNCNAADNFVAGREFGIVINSAQAHVSGMTSMSTPNAKCNVVSLTKVEEFTTTNNRMLAMSEHFLCYVVKEKLLRIIDHLSGKKTVLRGHTAKIVDVCYSTVSEHSNILCSTDCGVNENVAHTCVWRLLPGKQPDEIDYELVHESNIGASQIAAHPQNPFMWLLCKKNWVGVLNNSDIVHSSTLSNDCVGG